MSLFKPDVNCCAVAHAPRATVFIDGEAYFDAFARAAELAEESIIILAWDFHSRTVLRYDEHGNPALMLGDFLNDLVRRKPRLHIRILDWDYPMLFGTDREFPPIYGLEWKPHRHIDFRFDDTHPLAGSHHQKIVTIDDRLAFVGGLDLTNGRWDTPRHAPGDPRRTFAGEPYPPFHDMMMALDGEAAAALAKIARERWHAATGEDIGAPGGQGDRWPDEFPVHFRDVPVGVSCTAPPVDGKTAVTDVERLYLDMIAAARRYIYIENQYFTSEKIADALAARLAEPDGPEIVLVTRLLSHGWLEEKTMTLLRTKLVRGLRAADHHAHFHVYFPHVEGLEEGTCLDLHSKVMIVDDEWLRIGSSNLSRRSMAMDTECDVTVEARGDDAVRRTIREIRDRLIAEHSGAEPAAMAARIEAEGGMANAIAKSGSPRRRLGELEAPEVPDSVLSVAAAIGDIEKPIPLDGLVRSFTPDTSGKRVPPGTKAVIVMTLVAIVLALGWQFTPLSGFVSLQAAYEWAHEIRGLPWAPLLVILAYTPASLVMFPRWLITMAAVIAFGAWAGFAYAMSGAVLAATASYLAGRRVHRDTVRRLAGRRLNMLSRALVKRGVIAVTLVRLVPIAPFVVVNLVMGAMRIRPHHFVIGSILGFLPGMLAATVLSDQIAASFGDRTGLNPWTIGAAVFAIAALAYFGQRWLREAARRETDLAA
ncbi:MAG TPA: VTT domain-containing protein [Usitatibacter sp.]|nr:VTT domain-containing protein [Usitatibacter sp.]